MPLAAGAPLCFAAPPVPAPTAHHAPAHWSPTSWKAHLAAHQVVYEDRAAVDAAVARLSTLPPLVTSWEIERLKQSLAEAQQGRRFVLQGGDCAEALADCRPDAITNKLKILLQMSLVLVHAAKRPVVRIGRFAGQYAKPRSSKTETRRDATGRDVALPSYFGDLINGAEFTAEARRPDPHHMVRAYQHAALTINFIRALTEGGFADLHHPEYWDLSFFHHAGLTPELREQYQQMSRRLSDALRFMEALGETSVHELTRVEFFTSHEALNLLYESAQTRMPPRRERFYNLTTHMPWLGDRTRDIQGAHVEYLRGIANPIGVKLGTGATSADVTALLRALNPSGEAGRITLVTRLGAGNVAKMLPPLIDAVRLAGHPVLWMCDPMHGNSVTTTSGVKTRDFGAIAAECDATFDAHARTGSSLGGVHFELTGEDVTECIGGAGGLTEADLDRNYQSPCDPRLNYHQAMELAFRIAARLTPASP